MQATQLSGWKQKIVAFAGALGAPGLFLISFLDSSVLTFPVINDLLLIELSMQKPLRMPLYAAMAMIGSVLGCVFLYFIAKKGGEAFFRKKAGARAQATAHVGERSRRVREEHDAETREQQVRRAGRERINGRISESKLHWQPRRRPLPCALEERS